MDSLLRQFTRLVAALEDLAEQESAAMVHRDFASLLAIQERAEPLVAFLVSAGNRDSIPAELSIRIATLRARREQTSRALAAELDKTRRELEETSVAQRQVARVAPAYGGGTIARRQLLAVG